MLSSLAGRLGAAWRFWLDGKPADSDAGQVTYPRWLSPRSAYASLIVVVLAAGIAAYDMARHWVEDAIERELSSVAHMKTDQIERWLEERRADADVVVASPLFMLGMRKWLDGIRDPGLTMQLIDHLNLVSTASHFAHFCLRSTASGAPLALTDCHADSPRLRNIAMLAASSRLPQLEDFHRDGDSDAGLDIGIFNPVTLNNGQTPELVAHVSLDPSQSLFPRLQQWPGASPSAETLLVRRDGDQVVFLNTLRYRSDAPLTLHRSLADMGLLASLAIQGSVGLVRGHDYRDVPSVGYIMPVTGTPWFLVAKMDAAEADAWLDRLSFAILCCVALVLVIAYRWWSERQGMEQDRQRQAARLDELSHRLISLQERERRLLSAELHDRTSPNLAALDINLRSLAKSLPPGTNEEAIMLLDDATALLADTGSSLREVCADLRPPVLDYAGLLPALQSYAHQFSTRTGISVELVCPKELGRLDPELESTLFRIVQEALSNCAKHAHAHYVGITVTIDERHIDMEISDDGNGFAIAVPDIDDTAAGFGLRSMSERAQFAGGSLRVDSCPGEGTHLFVTIPIGPFSASDVEPTDLLSPALPHTP